MNAGKTPYFLRQGSSASIAYGSSSDLTSVRNGTSQTFIITHLGWVVNDQYADFKLKLSTNIINAFQSAGFSLLTITSDNASGYGGKAELPVPIVLGPNQEMQCNAENFNTDKSTTSYIELTYIGYLVSDS